MNSKQTPRQHLIHAAVLALHPALIDSEDAVWRAIDRAAQNSKGTAVYIYYETLDADSPTGTRLLNAVRREAREYYS